MFAVLEGILCYSDECTAFALIVMTLLAKALSLVRYCTLPPHWEDWTFVRCSIMHTKSTGPQSLHSLPVF